MRARTNLLIDAIILAGYLVATNPVTTGTPVHEWLSIGLALVALVHLVVHWDWTVRVTRRLLTRLGTLPRINLLVDAALLAAIVTCVLSGLAVSRAALSFAGRTVSDTSIWHAVHSESSTVLLALVGVHLGLHWSWVASTIRYQVVGPLLRPGAGPTAVAARRADRRTPTPLTHQAFVAAARTAGVLAVVAILAAAVWTIAPAAQDHLSWLVLPGGMAVAGQHADIAVASRAATTAAGFAGSSAQRVAVRVSHSLVVLVLAGGLGVALRELARNN